MREEVIEQTCRLAGTRVPVIVGITDTSYKDAIRMAARSYQCGACGGGCATLLLPGGPGGPAPYFKRLALESPLPLYLYNAPLNTPLDRS